VLAFVFAAAGRDRPPAPRLFCTDRLIESALQPANTLSYKAAMPTTPSLPDTPLEQWRGIGPERAAQLARLKLFTVADLLLHRPRRYEDRRHSRKIADLRLHEAATVRGHVVAFGTNYYRKRTRSVFELIVDDGTARLHCRWWNLPFMEKYFHQGDEIFVFGKPNSLKPRTIDHPETEVIEAGEDSSIHINRIVPVYPLTEGLAQRWLRGLVWRVLGQFESRLPEPWPAGLLPDLPGRAQAIRQIHFPAEMSDAESARRRLALDEFIELQLAIQRRRQNLQRRARGLPCGGDNRLIKPFLARLGFKLTGAQTRVLRQLRADLAGQYPMRRLVQGDVGSGKTVVAACCALMAIESGFTVALMAPTEILAEQHYGTFKRWFDPLGVPVELQTGGRKTLAPQPRTARDANPPALLPARPTPRAPALIVGTHALIEAAFQMPRLGLVVIDEQHKFGVVQREQLVRKGRYPHLLVMTATPIPRTLGLTLYGDLDVSVIDELPPGRGRIRTFARSMEQLPKVYAFIRQKIAEGRQAYVVYPRVEESDLPTGTKAVMQEFQRLEKEFAPSRVGLLHGRLPATEKERVMTGFRANRIQLLLATSVIEVGVDVPNATVMLVEGAQQFGLAQLHQLRGRIGRGTQESHCIFVGDLKTPEAKQRLQVLAQTTDGFRIAEADLKLRGPGELLGQEQSGLPAFRFGDLVEDLALIERARALAARLLAADPRSGAPG
jgi:ATP-dependent DNA helicase RecG